MEKTFVFWLLKYDAHFKTRINDPDNHYHSKPGRIIIIADGIAVTTGYNLLVIEKIREMEFSEYKFYMHVGDYYG